MTIATWVHAARPITLVASIIPIISAMLILPTATFKINIFSMDANCSHYYSNCY